LGPFSYFPTKYAHDLVQKNFEQCQGTGTTLPTLFCETQRREIQLEHEGSREQTPATAKPSAFVPWVRWELILSRETNPKCEGKLVVS